MKMSPTPTQSPSSKRNKIIALAAVLIVAMGGYALVVSRASGFFASVNPATSTLSGNAKLVNDVDGTKVVQFNAPVVTPPTTPPVTGERTCAAFPAMPDEKCTGIPAGVDLTIINGDFSTTADGQVIDAKLIKGGVNVNHNNVTIKNTRITGAIYYQMSGRPDVKGLVIKDSDIGPARTIIGPVTTPLAGLVDECPANSNGGTRLIRGSDFTLLRSRVHNNGADAISLYGTSNGSGTILIQDNIIDRTCFYGDDHLDTIQLYDPGSVAKVNIIHNKIDVRPVNTGGKGNAAIFWADHPGSGSRLTFYHNLLEGGNYTVYALDASSNSGVVIDGHDNLFTKGSYTYGPCGSDVSVPFNGTSGLKWTNNKFTDGSLINC